MRARDLGDVPWTGDGGLRLKPVAPGVDLFSVTTATELPNLPGPSIALVLGGEGSLVVASATVLAAPGVVLDLPGTERLQVLPSGDSGVVLLRFPHPGWSDRTAAPKNFAKDRPPAAEDVSPPSHHGADGSGEHPADRSPESGPTPAPTPPPTSAPPEEVPARMVRPQMPRLLITSRVR